MSELEAIEAYLNRRFGDQFAFSIPESSEILHRSLRWTRQKVAKKKLKSVSIGGQRRILRPEIIRALMEGVEI
jgi:hypothetical protein